MRDHQGEAGIFGHHLQPLSWKPRIHRDVRGTSFEHRQHRWKQVLPPWEADAHALAWRSASGLQHTGDAVGLCIELLIGELTFMGHHRNARRGALRLQAHPGFDASVRIQGPVGQVPVKQALIDGHRRCCRGRCQDLHQTADQCLCPLQAQMFAAVMQVECQCIGLFVEVEEDFAEQPPLSAFVHRGL